MNKTNLTVATKADVSKLIKPKFGPGMLLRAEDLDLLKNYTRDLSRLMFRSLFGCGVVCGLVVTVDEDCGMFIIEVGSGLAIACSGDPIYIPKDVTFPLHDDCDEATVDEEVWIILCSKEKCCGPRTSICASDEDDSPVECTREKDWYEIKAVTSPPECVCSCIEKAEDAVSNTAQARNESTAGVSSFAGSSAASTAAEESECKCATGPCYEDHYGGLCGCHCGDCSDCECNCVLLAHAKRVGDTNDWDVDHSVRRFVRPVLMRDPKIGKPQPSVTGTSARRSVRRAAFIAAEDTVVAEAAKAAESAARARVKKLATDIGQQAADSVIKQIAVDAAKEAMREALAERARVGDTAAVREQVELEEENGTETDTDESGGSPEAGKTTRKSTKK